MRHRQRAPHPPSRAVRRLSGEDHTRSAFWLGRLARPPSPPLASG
jgi:hypothetical protein